MPFPQNSGVNPNVRIHPECWKSVKEMANYVFVVVIYHIDKTLDPCAPQLRIKLVWTEQEKKSLLVLCVWSPLILLVVSVCRSTHAVSAKNLFSKQCVSDCGTERSIWEPDFSCASCQMLDFLFVKCSTVRGLSLSSHVL